MFQIIKERERVTEISYSIEFYKKLNDTGAYDDSWGFSFPCDKEGNLLEFTCEEAKKNYKEVSADTSFIRKFNKYTHSYTAPAIAKCRCGNKFEVINQFYGCCECDRCGQWYTLSGQEVIPPNEQMRLVEW